MPRELLRFQLFLLWFVPAFVLLWSAWVGQTPSESLSEGWLLDSAFELPGRLSLEVAVLASVPLGLLQARALRRGADGREYAAAHAVIAGAVAFAPIWLAAAGGGERRWEYVAAGVVPWLFMSAVMYAVVWAARSRFGAGEAGRDGMWVFAGLRLLALVAVPALFVSHLVGGFEDADWADGAELRFLAWPLLAGLPLAVWLGILEGLARARERAGIAPFALFVLLAGAASLWSSFLAAGIGAAFGEPYLDRELFIWALLCWAGLIALQAVICLATEQGARRDSGGRWLAASDVGLPVIALWLPPLAVLAVLYVGGFDSGLLALPGPDGPRPRSTDLATYLPLGLLLVALPLGLLSAKARVEGRPVGDLLALQSAVIAVGAWPWFIQLPSTTPPNGALPLDGQFLCAAAIWLACMGGAWFVAAAAGIGWRAASRKG